MKTKNIFLIAQYFQKPKDHVNTSVSGWMKNPENIRWDEQVSIATKMKTRDMNAQVVLNLSTKTIVRNTFQSGKEFDDIFRYFLENYPQYIAQTMSMLDPDYLTNVATQIQAELDSTPPEAQHSVFIEAEILDEKAQAV